MTGKCVANARLINCQSAIAVLHSASGVVLRLQLPVIAFCFSATHGKLLEERMVRKTLQYMKGPTHAFYIPEYAALLETTANPGGEDAEQDKDEED